MYRLRNESDDTNPIDDSFTSDDQSIASSHSSLIRRNKNGCYRNFCNSGKIIPMIITLITLSIVTAFIVVFANYKSLKESNLELTGKVSTLTAENFIMKSELKDISKNNTMLSTQRKELNAKVEALEEENKKVKMMNYNLMRENNENKINKETIQNSITSTDEEIKKLKEKLKEKEVEHYKFDILISEYHKKIKTLNETNIQLIQEINGKTVEIENVRNSYNNILKRFDSLSQENAQMANAIQEKKNFAIKENELNEKINNLQSQIKSLQTENEQLKKDIQTHISTENKLKKSNQSLSKEITELHNSIESSNTQIAKMNSEIARLIDINSRNTGDSFSIINSILHSTILKYKSDINILAKQLSLSKPVTLSMIYKATLHGDTKDAIHSKIDKNSPTLIVIETTDGMRFGGYTKAEWKPVGKFLKTFGKKLFKQDDEAFLFNLENGKKYSVKEEKKAIKPDYSNALVFGDGDLTITSGFLSKDSSSEFPKSYNGNKLELTKGKNSFRVKDIEVFTVKIGY